MILYYKNSFLASVVSIFGCLLVILAINYFNSSDIAEGIMCVVLALALLICGKVISNRKAFKKWWKQVTDAGLDEKIKTDPQLALQIYNKNPQARTLKQIGLLNPAAAQYIRERIPKK